ncbi:nucleosome assembly protein 1;2-like [Magnolia sinica]|uniref:nucleosome assembly protein 1;2-like n=1 Tax=Magnolia sinica TaxID=86752 RepID=UPI00265901A6|nr:nucleosome assembly protein 1;2-like [Magnolia sinica]
MNGLEDISHEFQSRVFVLQAVYHLGFELEHQYSGSFLTDFLGDEGALKYLKDIKWFRINDPKGFKLEFFFDPNPYFKNTILTKTYHIIDDDEPILEKAIGTEIEWYPRKSLTQKVLKKKPKKGSKNAKPITKTEQCDSFFNFFNLPQVPNDDNDDIDEETVEQLQNQMEQDYDVGYMFFPLNYSYVSCLLHSLQKPLPF